MDIFVVNSEVNSGLPPISDLRKQIIEDAAFFYATILLNPRTVKKLVLDIALVPDMDVKGECINEDGTKKSRWFTINLCDDGTEDPIQTLAHEMVHVKQYVKNELYKPKQSLHKGGQKTEAYWKGKPWKPKAREHPYFDAPWEIIAFGREVGLYSRWISFYKDNYEGEYL